MPADHTRDEGAEIAVDPSANDPGIGSSDEYEVDSLASLRSSILQHQVENGRTYHSMSEGKYQFPNDEQENERLDLQHHLWILSFDGELALSPNHDKAKRVLDMGTGSGIWAMDFADAFPSAEVIGADLSPSQPSWVPPNCRFEVDDLENEWTYKEPFDLIFCRGNAGCFSDVPEMIQKIYDNITPGGYFETGDLEFPLGCDDGSIPETAAIWRWHQLIHDAASKAGKPLEPVGKDLSVLEKTGFVDVEVREFRWPINPWPKDKVYKEIGRWHCANLDMGLEAFSLALLTRVMGWSKEEVLAICAEVRRDIRNPRLHGFWRLRVVHARKPEKPKETTT